MSKITTQGINVEVSESLNDHIQEQFSKLFALYENLIVGAVEVKIEVDKHHEHLNMASVTVPVSGKNIVMDESGDDMYHVLTTLQQRVSRKLRKTKEKMNDKRGGFDKRQVEDETEE